MESSWVCAHMRDSLKDFLWYQKTIVNSERQMMQLSTEVVTRLKINQCNYHKQPNTRSSQNVKKWNSLIYFLINSLFQVISFNLIPRMKFVVVFRFFILAAYTNIGNNGRMCFGKSIYTAGTRLLPHKMHKFSQKLYQ